MNASLLKLFHLLMPMLVQHSLDLVSVLMVIHILTSNHYLGIHFVDWAFHSLVLRVNLGLIAILRGSIEFLHMCMFYH